MSLTSRLFALCVLAVSTAAFGQSTTQEDLGTITAQKLAAGLGWNIGDSEIEFQAAAAAGATHVRIVSCGWAFTEGQSAPPNNTSTGYTLPPTCVSSLTFAKKYGLQPTVLAAYGAPYHQILTVTLPSGAAKGATSVPVEYVAGMGGKNLSSIVYPYSYLSTGNPTLLSYQRSYPGTLITSLTSTGTNNATVTLASALTTALAPGTTLIVNEVLYPSPATGNPTDPSIMAYAHYAEYLAKQVNAFGLIGDVEIWNEPPWLSECWDNRRDCYDVDPQIPNELPGKSPNFGFVAALQALAPVPNVPYVWAGSNKTFSGGVMSSSMLKYTGQSYIQPQPTVLSESLHPYGNNPEDNMWNQPCLVANPKAGQHCNTIPVNNANMILGESGTLNARLAGGPTYGVNHVITETGTSTVANDLPHIARFTMRQFLGYMADDITYIEFYRLLDTPSANGDTVFSFITVNNSRTAYTPLPSFTALEGLMSDLAPMKSAPVASYTTASLPQVTSYAGTYNLAHLSIVGARPGDTANSILYTLWQRSQWQTSGGLAVGCLTWTSIPCWGTIPQPVGAYTTVSIPAGMKIDQALNLDTRLPVSYSQSGASVTLPVSDDPIELMFIPSSDGAVAAVAPKLLFAVVPTQKQGNSVDVVASSVSKGAITYSIASGPATISGNTVTLTGPGSVTVAASQAATSSYTAATATTSFNVTAVTPVISFIQVPTRTYGDAVTVHTSSQSPGAITYSIVSGPATISGSAVTLTGVGTVVVGASQVRSGVYTPATATMSFPVVAKQPVLVFDHIANQVFGSKLTVNATSASSGAVTYTVTSGPATISGATISFTNSGEVFLAASQAASGGYSAATTTGAFYVYTATPTLTFAPISTTPFNTSFTVTATSASSAAVVYAIGSGPAGISGSTVRTRATPGTVVVNAYQPGANGYAGASATISFQVADVAAPTLTFASIPSKTAGDVFNVSASSASTGAITYSLLSGPATLSGSTVTTTGAGAVVIQASQAASGAYATTTATTTVQVTAVSPNLTFASIPSKTAGDVFTVLASSASKGAVTYSVLSGPATLSGSTVTTTGAGAVVVQASQVASGSYLAATSTTTVQVTAATSTLTFASVPSKNAGDTFAVSASSASAGAITYTVLSGPATLSGSTVTTTGPGAVVLQASQAASGVYAAATATTTVQVIAITPNLTFASIPPHTAGDVFSIVASSASKGTITYSVLSGPATGAGSTVTTTGPGAVVLQASQAASGAYTSATASTTVQVAAITPSLTFAGIPSHTAGDVFTVSASSASKGTITYSLLSGPATSVGSTVTTTGPGAVVLQASQAASGTYAAATASTTVQVAAIKPTLIFAGIPSHTAGDVFTVSASSASKGAITYTVASGPATASGGTITTTGTGAVVIQADQAASGSYSAATTVATLQVAAVPALTLAPVSAKNAGDIFTVSATSPSNGAITYKVASGPAILLSGSTYEVTGAGTVTLNATQAASGPYKFMGANTSFVATGNRPTTLLFQPIGTQFVGSMFAAKATSASSAPITYSVIGGSATVSGSQVTITGTPGMVTLQANQAAAGSYPAASTTITFLVSPMAPTIAFAPIVPQTSGSVVPVKVISSSTGFIHYRVVSGPAVLTGTQLSVTGPGTVVLRADQDAVGGFGQAHAFTNVQVQ